MDRSPVGDRIVAADGTTIRIRRSSEGDNIGISLEMQSYRKCILHWGLALPERSDWQVPPESFWPSESQAADRGAVESAFIRRDGLGRIDFNLPAGDRFSAIEFALFYPEEHRWDNNAGRNYRIRISGEGGSTSSAAPLERLKAELANTIALFEHEWAVGFGSKVAVAVSRTNGQYRVLIATDLAGPLLLHWGVARRSLYDWQLPSPSLYPPGTITIQNKAAQTLFEDRDGIRRLQLDFSQQEVPRFMVFVLYQPEPGRWLKNAGIDFRIPVVPPSTHELRLTDSFISGIAEEIIQKEMSGNSWTLMHRFDLCFDLLDRVGHNIDGLALLFVWLRFSALRQLDWQRNYNTKPRELGHSLDRLTRKLADRYAQYPDERELLRLIMSTLGRGTDAQRVRDEVLNIMHRHHIKEISGHFMEEWHQKLHNNTTYDDVVICEAYLEFLRSDGELDRFYRKLEEEGVTKQRLESFERPIVSQPDFIAPLKGPLIRDFEHFLGLLREVHSGTDLGTAIHLARPLLDGEMNQLLDFIWEHREARGTAVKALVTKITEARKRMVLRLSSHENGVRDLLFLDLALENFLRLVLERNFQFQLSGDDLLDLIGIVLQNLSLSAGNEEFANSLNLWRRLAGMARFQREWSLLTLSALDRLYRALGVFVDRYHQRFQPMAEVLGNAFRAEGWTINLFSEDVIRGRNEFVLSILIGKLTPMLRRIARLGDWQIISPGQGKGVVHSVSSLKSVMGALFQEATVLLTDNITGNEEIPSGVTAVLTPQTTDVVSHLAIRARNAHVLFATCYDPAVYERLRSLQGRFVSVTADVRGEVFCEESTSEAGVPAKRERPASVTMHRPHFTGYAVTQNGFSAQNVGGKSNNLKRYGNRLPDWISVPSSVALPFMVFERVLSEAGNGVVAGRYREMTAAIERAADGERRDLLRTIRRTLQDLKAPDELKAALRSAMQDTGLEFPADWESAWKCITTVWASKWNERAYWSRETSGISHEELIMAVLVQPVLDADYSFVIHTVNPLTGDADELYAEVVLGLGETLVGNYPGRALAFTCRKGGGNPQVLGYPSKSEALYGSGLIFRSDSNGEDLVHYAGAGLYDSVMLPSPRRVSPDYANELLIWNEEFQKGTLRRIALVGETIEDLAGTPQDIEGVYSNGRYYMVQTRPQVGIVNG